VNEATQQAEKADQNVKSRAQKQGGFANLGMLSGAVPSKKVSPLGFFSKAEEVAQSKLPNAGSGESFANALRNNGVKPDEMKWSGLDDLLAKPKVTKQEVLDHLAQNNVQVQEVTNGGISPMDAKWLDRMDEILKSGERKLTPIEQEQYNRLTERDSLPRTSGGGPKFEAYQQPNVLAHVRFNDRTSPDGKKTLFIEELQSDWHQKGRKQGYATPESSAELAGIKSAAERGEMQNDLRRYALQNAVPDAPFKNTWHELAMKRMLRYASENGYDRLAWTTGEQQAGRYDLSKQVQELKYYKHPDDTFRLAAVDNSGNSHLVADKVEAAKLADYVGKEVAEKIARGEGTPKGEKGLMSLSGLDLKVGGEGMKGFYDKILPDFLNKYGKKWGARVQDTSINVGTAGLGKSAYEVRQTRDGWGVFDGDVELQSFGSHERNARNYADELSQRNGVGPQPVHSLDITSAMKKSVMEEGQPLFTVPPFLIPAAAGAGVAAAGYAANQKKKAKA
jgi:hypothetical protein